MILVADRVGRRDCTDKPGIGDATRKVLTPAAERVERRDCNASA